MKSASSPSAKPRNVKRKSASTKSRTDGAKLEARTAGVATREHPEADSRHVVRGMVRRGLQPRPAKAAVSLRVDEDVIEWFKAISADVDIPYLSLISLYLRDCAAVHRTLDLSAIGKGDTIRRARRPPPNK